LKKKTSEKTRSFSDNGVQQMLLPLALMKFEKSFPNRLQSFHNRLQSFHNISKAYILTI